MVSTSSRMSFMLSEIAKIFSISLFLNVNLMAKSDYMMGVMLIYLSLNLLKLNRENKTHSIIDLIWFGLDWFGLLININWLMYYIRTQLNSYVGTYLFTYILLFHAAFKEIMFSKSKSSTNHVTHMVRSLVFWVGYQASLTLCR